MSSLACVDQNNMATKSKLEDLNLSQDEIKRLGDALKDEKFRKMLLEYAEEISDPENRRKYEEEIAQMEAERGMDVTFVRPDPGYVLKTSINGEKKAFINISKCDKIDKPSSERKQGSDGKAGLLWHIPHSFAPPREDYDKEKNRCQVYDFVIHPDTYRMAESNERFRKLVEDTAMDGIEKQFEAKLDRKNVKRPKMKFKGVPTPTVIRNRTSQQSQSPSSSEGSDFMKDMPYPYDNKTTMEKMQERQQTLEKKAAAKKNEPKKKPEDDATIPKYTIVHRSEVDMQEYRNAPDAKPSTRPRELIIKIELPLLKSAAQVNLDIFEKRLVLESKEPAVYKLDLNLPYHVDESEGSAKFDKQKRTLTITLPVIPDTTPAVPSFLDNARVDVDDDKMEDSKGPPLIEVLSSSEGEVSATSHSVNSSQDAGYDLSTESNKPGGYSSSVPYNLPEFTFTQDAETVSFVLKVKNVTEDSVRRRSPITSMVELTCTSRGDGGFPLHYRLCLKFDDSCCIVPEHCSVDVAEDNVVLLLLKDRMSRGLWNHFWAGLDADNQEVRLLSICIFSFFCVCVLFFPMDDPYPSEHSAEKL
jgi:dynein assembly factor 2